MLIMNQKRSELVNLDNVVLLAKYDQNGETEYYAYANNHSVSLGAYENTENLLEKIAKSIGATEVFYMPEE